MSLPSQKFMSIESHEEGFGNVPRWENMNKDILSNIFKKLDLVDVIMGASRVCINWFLASHNKTLWKTIKLNELDSIILDNPKEPSMQDSVIEKRRYHLMNILIEINNFSRNVPINLFFNRYTIILEEDLTFISERMPNINRLALPMWKPLSQNSFRSAFSKWKNLKTLILGPFQPLNDSSTARDQFELQTIGETCRNLTTIKLFRMLSKIRANDFIRYLPNLERVSFRRQNVCREAATSLIIGLPNLKILNLTHCRFSELQRGENYESDMTPSEELIRIGTEKLDKLIVCCSDCPICQDIWKHRFRQRDPYKDHNSKEKLWKSDEIEELAY
ncbi:putative F-box protein At4g11580 [Capsella rubella]|uniref:putative F-box protein At4g11580 n=1 Tax=Capsella rubella TaxID=81985 RepID=UPI000CD51F56|nr:putative F-box protein At4g11580 [Capsella rubella]